MQILTVSHFFESHGGGIERVAGQLSREFARLGATSVWTASDGDPLPTGDIQLAPLPCINPTEKLTGLPMPVPGLRGIWMLAREVRRSDAVVVHDALYATSILALLIAKVRAKRVILVQHIGTIAFPSRILRLLMSVSNFLITRPMLWAADERVFISDTVRREFLGGRARRSGELLFNGVDGSIFYPADAPRAGRDAGPESTRPKGLRVLFVGRYVEKKGLKIVRTLAALRPDLTFFLVGRGPIRPSEWKLANVHDLAVQRQEALADLYRSADLLLLPSAGEGYPLVVQEAMACGLPVVCGEPSNRADPYASRWLKGVRIDLTDPWASAQRLSEAINNFDLSVAERAEMARYALHKYDWGAMAHRLMALAETPRAVASA